MGAKQVGRPARATNTTRQVIREYGPKSNINLTPIDCAICKAYPRNKVRNINRGLNELYEGNLICIHLRANIVQMRR